MNSILIVDDDKYMCRSLSYLLKEKGYNVNTAFDGEDALSKLKKNRCMLILIDYNLSGLNGMTGLNVLERVFQIDPSIRSIMISAYGDERIKSKARDIGVDGFLDKPFKINTLLKTIGNSVNKNREKVMQTVADKANESRTVSRKRRKLRTGKEQNKKESV